MVRYAVAHRWPVDLTGADRVNLRHGPAGLSVADGAAGPAVAPAPRSGASTRSAARSGTYTSASITTTAPVSRLRWDLRAVVPTGSAVTVDVRGLTGGRWSEWREAGPDGVAVLPGPATAVQARLDLRSAAGGVSPTVSGLVLRPAAGAATGTTAEAAATPPRSYRVYATPEGLVGGTTANGHVITRRDHFVALPSRRALASNGGREYRVKVCYARTGRCETAPVWDVGPRNTRDDYWNPAPVRQMWRDLPRGRPEAQAAYQSGYNGGRDQFGRRVANPVGIDLADGTFWDGLGMTDNDWVTVTYLWTGTAAAGG